MTGAVLIAENILQRPTALGVPLGALLLTAFVLKAIRDSRK